MTWWGVGAAVVSAGTGIYSAVNQKKAASKALDAQRGIATDIKYEPIDIEKLKRNAQANAIENATASLAIERGLQPDVASVRAELARQVNADLQRGGELPPDVANRATMAARITGARSGVGQGATAPLTASLMGLSSLDLINQRRAAATNFLQSTALPVAGLDPGALASAEVANNAAYNQFNLEKAGVASSLAQSEADARAAQIAGQVGSVNSLAASIGKIGGAYGDYRDSRAGIGEKTSYDEFLKRYANPQPTYVPVQTSGFFT